MIDMLHDLAVCSLYIILIATSIGVVVLVAAGIYFIINDVRHHANK
nr:MAG TPA: hypothetical protein [Caudoviricetes sp.]